ncbi:TonB-dependent receptor plug domain-containing protein, partial [bacterium]|nr:TonB-dependent receptor plug domain-containing protein [bacterium]
MVIVLLLGMWPAGVLRAGDAPFQDIMELDLEALLDIEVVSVSKRAQSSLDAAAAVHVLTAEDIRRSGATTIADALRLVPGLDVRRIDSNKWAVTSRGFNGRFSNK